MSNEEERPLDVFVLAFLERVDAQKVRPSHEGYMAQCPLPGHDDSTASWTINTTTGQWVCFGCKGSGNLPMLMHQVLGIPLDEAYQSYSLERVADVWPTLPSRGEVDAPRLMTLPESVLIPYYSCPTYMLTRGFDKGFLKRFGIGFDKHEWRVTFPIRNLKGELVGVTKRATLPDDEPKYKHSRGFKKSETLYLIERVRQGQLVRVVYLCEGHIDALRFYQVLESDDTFGGAVALMGSMISKRQAQLLALAGVTEVALAFDHDKAGEIGEERAKEVLFARGFRAVYRADYPGLDPGEMEPGSRVGLTLL